MKKEFSVSCPMDCPDLCRYIVSVENNRITGLKGDPKHPVTRGAVCKKGRALIERHHHPDRLTHPLIRKKHGFSKISYSDAIALMADQLSGVNDLFGPTAILNYTCDGYGGLKGRIQNIFFNHLGGATVPVGSLCWGAGIAAQKFDFGSSRGHFPDDVEQSQLVIVWGRNPKYTNMHLYSRLKKAQKNGARVVVIDPVRTATAKSFDDYIRIKPSTDSALALAMSNIIIDKKLVDKPFVSNFTKGFNRFKSHIKPYTSEWASAITGISISVIEQLAKDYASAERACIYIGFGIQRYHNGGKTIRAIDALGAITGKIGKPGCGVNYAAKNISPFLSAVEKKSQAYIRSTRTFTIGELGRFLSRADDPGIKAAVVANGNPLNQSPDLAATVKAFSKIPFKVVFDHFMTDTAQHADLVLPAATVFEQEDIFTTSMYSPVLNYSHKAVDSVPGIMSEFDFYLGLAAKMGINTLGFSNTQSYLGQAAKPLCKKLDISMEELKETDRYIQLPDMEIAWENKRFETPSGRFEFYSESAEQQGQPGLPEFSEPLQGSAQFPLRLLTCHANDSLHSQGFAFRRDQPLVYINAGVAGKCSVKTGDPVRVTGRKAQLKAIVSVTDDIGDDIAFMYQGWWHKSGAVNFLTDAVITDMGLQAAYYESFVRIETL